LATQTRSNIPSSTSSRNAIAAEIVSANAEVFGLKR